jgi:hypothetical protein
MTLIRPSSKQVRKNIHTDIPSQFPAIYREEGPLFVEFVQAYYKYVDEQENNFRDAFSIRDIDTTFERFLVHFKKKYLDGLPLNTVTDIRFILKHIQDLYRRKGSKESLELLFRMFFNEEIEVVYPGYNILRISDSKYGASRYLEMKAVRTYRDYSIRKGDKIVGDTSKAEAFVDEIVFQNINGLIVPIVYLSNLFGKFTKDDSITVFGVRDGIEVTLFPNEIIYGSISEAPIDAGSQATGNVVGDRLLVRSKKSGFKATAAVSKVKEASTAVIEFKIQDGGWGYSVDIESNDVQISNATMAFRIFSDVVFASGYTPNADRSILPQIGDYFISDGTYSAGTARYNTGDSTLSGNTNFAYGKVIGVDTINSLVFVEFFGPQFAINTSDPTLYQTSTVESAGFDVYFYDKGYKVSALNILTEFGTYVNAGNVGQLQFFFEESINGRQRFDITDSGAITSADRQALDDYFNAELTNPDQRDWIELNIEEYLLANIDRIVGGRLRTGDDDQAADWYWGAVATENLINSDDPHINPADSYPISGWVTATSPYNDTATYRIGSITNAETVSFIPDIIGDFLDVELIDQAFPNNPEFTNYGMSGTQFENLNTPLRDAFTPVTYTIGEIDSLIVLSNGQDYQSDVKSLITIPEVSQYDRRDVGVIFENPSFLPNAGDIFEQIIQIEQFESGEFLDYTVRGRFILRTGDVYYFRPISFYTFVSYIDISFKGQSYMPLQIIRDETSRAMGDNADILGTAQFARGQIEKINILDTGFRYQDGESVEIIGNEKFLDSIGDNGAAILVPNPNFGNVVAKSTIRVLGTGFTESDWLTTTSFLNDPTKVIHDNFYYQEYSFDIKSTISPDVYRELVTDIVQPAGTKQFGSPLINTLNYVNAESDVSMEIYNFSYETISVEVLDIVTDTLGYEEANVVIDELVATIHTLDETLSTTITEDIND